MFSVRVCLGTVALKAIIDTAAEVTIISDRIYESLDRKPPRIRSVILNTAGRNMKLRGMVAGPLTVTLGGKSFQENIYVAPIEDDMLLGIDFLRHHNIDIHIQGSKLVLEGEDVPMEFGTGYKLPNIARVYVQRTTVIPPNSVKRVACQTDRELERFLFEPSPELHVLVPHTVHDEGHIAELYMINPTDRNVRLRCNQQIGEAQEIHAVIDIPETSLEQNIFVNKVDKAVDAEVPEHLVDLLHRSVEHLKGEERYDQTNLLIEFQDVFAKDEYDLGNFTSLEHKIDTGDANPVKHKLRRTPMSFVKEEKAHLDKMQAAGVIHPSVSEWASAPVLVRKRDGHVRWCVDYRGLNAVTRKDVYPLPRIEECLDTLAGNIWFSKLDTNSAYWQVKIDKNDQCKTAFVTEYGLFEFVRMGFGLCNAPATFSRVMNLVLRGLT